MVILCNIIYHMTVSGMNPFCTRSWKVHEWNMDSLLISKCREFDCHKGIPCTQIDNSRIRLLRTFASGFSMFFRPGTHI